MGGRRGKTGRKKGRRKEGGEKSKVISLIGLIPYSVK